VGALNVFSPQTGNGLSSTQAMIVQALADVAAIGLLQERAIARSELVAEQLRGALHTRVVIEQAKGIVAQAHQVSVDKAFDVMRNYARRNNLRLGVVASQVVTDLASIPNLAAD
jgi:AmiR/NasT family two-component response regulator